MTPPSFFTYLEFLLAKNFLKNGYGSFLEKPQSSSTFAERFGFDDGASKRYFDALQHYGILQREGQFYKLNSSYRRSSEQDELFSRYESFQSPLESTQGKWAYSNGSKGWTDFNVFARTFSADAYWTLKYHVLVINQFFQDHVLTAALKSGRSQAKLALGITRDQIFENYASNPDLLETYAEGFAHGGVQNNLELAKNLSFLGKGDYLDIGGGNGSQALAIRKLNPQLKSMHILDLPESKAPLQESRERWTLQYGVTANWRYDNFFSEKFGSDFTAEEKFDYIGLSWILHDWTDRQCIEILKRANSLLRTNGRIFVIEKLKSEANLANVQDFLMMVVADGHERTLEDYRTLYHQSNLELEKVVDALKGREMMIVNKT